MDVLAAPSALKTVSGAAARAVEMLGMATLASEAATGVPAAARKNGGNVTLTETCAAAAACNW